MDSRPTIEAFDAECSALVAVVETLTPAESSRPTNCPPWTLHELVVHIADSIEMAPEEIRSAPVAAPLGTAADYYRRPERDTAAYRTRNVTQTVALAATVPPDAVAGRLAERSRHTSNLFANLDPALPISVAGLALTADSYLLTRVMSVAAHGLDVAITLDRAPFTTALALRTLRPVLVDLLGGDPPNGWTDEDLLAIGTGRHSLTSEQNAVLGSLAARFPLLS
jgi:uncharacterized protein (TIGR03083 family)